MAALKTSSYDVKWRWKQTILQTGLLPTSNDRNTILVWPWKQIKIEILPDFTHAPGNFGVRTCSKEWFGWRLAAFISHNVEHNDCAEDVGLKENSLWESIIERHVMKSERVANESNQPNKDFFLPYLHLSSLLDGTRQQRTWNHPTTWYYYQRK